MHSRVLLWPFASRGLAAESAEMRVSWCQRGFSGKACASLLLLADASSPRVWLWKGGKDKGTMLKGTALSLNAQVGGIVAWSYFLGEGEDVGNHQEKHCASL